MSQAAPAGVRTVTGSELKSMLGMPKEHKEERAFGWPTGSVRAAICLLLVSGLIAGVAIGAWAAGSDGAQAAGATLGTPAGAATSYYFTKRGM
jgi:hypothetical protein